MEKAKNIQIGEQYLLRHDRNKWSLIVILGFCDWGAARGKYSYTYPNSKRAILGYVCPSKLYKYMEHHGINNLKTDWYE